MRFKAQTRRRAAAAVMAAGLVALTTGCGSDDGGGSTKSSPAAPAKKEKIMTFVFAPRGFNDVTKAWFNGFDAAAKQLGSSVDVQQKATSKIEPDAGPYLSFIRSALVQRPDGIVVVPNNAAALTSGLKQIAAQGTKVLIMDQDVPKMDNKVAFVGTDNKAAGKVAADWMIEQAKAGKLPSDEVGILRSPPGITSTDDRAAGFKAALAGTDLKVVSELAPACNDSADARSAMADMLTAHPKLGGVFSVCDIIATGAARVLVAKGRDAVAHVSVDASKQGVDAILKHKGIDAEVAQHLLRVGQQSVATLVQALRGKSVPATVDTGTDLVT
ncbi:MAG TPA: sugar ABC transporter substrate-binding protein, partial [Solirubrobacteraceae bacterium]